VRGGSKWTSVVARGLHGGSPRADQSQDSNRKFHGKNAKKLAEFLFCSRTTLVPFPAFNGDTTPFVGRVSVRVHDSIQLFAASNLFQILFKSVALLPRSGAWSGVV
jgi:hypothetical protein